MELLQVGYSAILPMAKDFQRKAGHVEGIPDDSFFIGIYDQSKLIGYFVLVGYDDLSLEVNQGYLTPEAQHRHKSNEAMTLLHSVAKKSGYKRIILKASRSLRAYSKFMARLGYKPESVIYSRGV